MIAGAAPDNTGRICPNFDVDVALSRPISRSQIAILLGFNLLLPLGSGFETVCVLIGVASAMVFSALWMTHSGTVETPVRKSLAAMEMPVRIP